MRSYPYEDGKLLFGVDPAQLRTAIAYRFFSKEDQKVRAGTAKVGDILDASDIEEVIRGVADQAIFTEVWLAVEFPSWNAGASTVVRAAAHTYIRLFKRIFGESKVKVLKVDPNSWQKSFLSARGNQDTKTFSKFVASKVYGWDIKDDPDRADAALILEYLRTKPLTERITKSWKPKPKTLNPKKSSIQPKKRSS